MLGVIGRILIVAIGNGFIARQGWLIKVTVVGSQEMVEARRHHLAALVYEVEARGLQWRLAGPGDSVLRVASPVTARQIMVVATPTGTGWSYLWTGGGQEVTGRPAEVADKIARLLSRGEM